MSTPTLLGNHSQFANSQQAIFNPRELFGANEQGLWLDPSDMTAGKAGWRRNLLTYSEQLDNSVWSKDLSSISANASTSPDGTTTADKLIPDNTSGVHRLRLLVLSTTSFSYTVSFYAKASEISKICFREGNTTGAYAAFDLSNGTIIHQGQGGTGAVISVGSGWYRCSVSFTAGASARIDIIALPNSYTSSNSPIENFTFNGTDGFFLWGIQYEQSSSPSEYQPITDFSTEFKAAFPTHTLYQDSNGVTPCTAAGDPVGLILDQSRGGLGAKTQYTLTNGSFDSALTGWGASNATTDTSTSGQVSVTSTSGAAYGFIQATGANVITTAASNWYEIVVDCELISGTGFIGAYTTSGVYTFFTDTGRKTRKIIVQGSNVEARAGVTNSIGTSIIVYDIKVYQVPGNHAYQTTSASRPTLARIPSSGRRNLLTRTEELSNAAWSQTNTSNGSFVNGVATVTDAEGYTYGTQSGTFSTTTDHAVSFDVTCNQTVSNVPLRVGGTVSVSTVANLTAGQTARVTLTGYRPFAGSIQIGLDARDAVVAGGSNSTGYTVTFNRVQLETGSTATNYQKVVATTDVTESGVGDLWHLVFDGSDDSLVTNSVDFNTWTQETRRNLLVDTESFGSSNWTRLNITAADNTTETTDPLGTNTSSKLTASSSTTRCAQNFTGRTAGENWVFSFYVKAGTATQVQYIISNGLAETSNSIGEFTFSNQTFSGSLGTYVTSRTATDVGNGWYRIVLICTIPAGQTAIRFNPALPIVNTATAYYWGAQAELATSATAYQRVGTDEMTVITGLRKLNSTPLIVVELSADLTTNTGTFYLATGSNPSDGFWTTSRGTQSNTTNQSTNLSATAIETAVISSLHDISGDLTTIRKNSTGGANATGEKGSGNFGNYAIYIGRRGGATLPYNGHIYQLIIRGRTTPTGKLLEAERFVGKKTGVNL